MNKTKQKKNRGDFLPLAEKTALSFSFSRVPVFVDLRKAKENNVCVKAKLTL